MESAGFGEFGKADTVGTEREIVAAEQSLADAERALDALCDRAQNDAQVVAGFAAELQLLEEKLAALGAGSAMAEVERKLAVARGAVEKLGRSELSSIKTMKQPPPTIKRVITAVYCLLNAKRVVAPRFDVEWSGGPNSCQGLLGRRNFTEEVSRFDASQLCEYPELLEYVSTNFIGEQIHGGTESRSAVELGTPVSCKITESRSAAELSPVSSPVRGPGEVGNAPMSKSVLFGRRAGAEREVGGRTPSLSSMYAVTSMATITTHINHTAQSRRDKRNADWAEVGYSDKVAPRRLTYDEVTYASKACGALYLWASTAVDTAKALQNLYPVKKHCDDLNARRNRVQQRLSDAEATFAEVLAKKTSSVAQVENARGELARLQALLIKLKSEAEATAAAKEQAEAAAAAAKQQTEATVLAAAEEQAARDAREREEHERKQASINEAAVRRRKAREDAVARAAEKIQVTKVDVVIKQSLTFEKGKVVVEDMAIPALIAVAQVMKDHNDCKVNVRGRPDSNDGGNSDFRVSLSRDRAQAVCDWLVSQGGVSISRLRTTTVDESTTSDDDGLDDNWSAFPRHCLNRMGSARAECSVPSLLSCAGV